MSKGQVNIALHLLGEESMGLGDSSVSIAGQ